MILENSQISLPNTSYYPQFLSEQDADMLYEQLLTLPRLTSMLEMEVPGGKIEFDFGKLMFLEEQTFESGQFVESAWGPLGIYTKELLALKDRLNSFIGESLDVCVAIYYPNGSSWVDFHADKPAFGDTNVIASISLGAEREFSLKDNRSGTIFSKVLEHGSLLVMEEGCQDNFEHSLPKDPGCNQPRINLTFRKLGFL